MEANELRIGNYVYNDYLKKNKQINGIFDNEIWLSEIGEDEFDQRSIIDSINPIPLTEKWLVDLGFVKEKDLFWLGEYIVYKLNKKKLYLFGIDSQIFDQCYQVNCEYVHQLQNLCFVLTNKELVLTK